MKTLVAGILLCICGFANPAHAFSCHDLEFQLAIPGGFFIKEVTCSKGTITSKSDEFLTVKQSGGHGPSCDVVIYAQAHDIDHSIIHMSTLHIQQNLCVLKAGNIHVSLVSGRLANYSTREGSFINSLPGYIKVTGWQ